MDLSLNILDSEKSSTELWNSPAEKSTREEACVLHTKKSAYGNEALTCYVWF